MNNLKEIIAYSQRTVIFDLIQLRMTSAQLIEELKKVTQDNINILKSKIINLSGNQKSWRKDSESWNLNEIFAHLNEYASYYHPTFLRRISKTRYNEPKELFVSSPLGRSAWKSMKLGNARNVKRKFKSQRNYNPLLNPELVKGDDIETFLKDQEEMLGIIDKAATVNLRKVKVPISISKIVRLRLGDALLFVVYHNERHIQQALSLISNKNFPQE